MGPPVPPNLPGVLTAGPGVGGCGARPTPRRSWGHTRMDRSPGRWHTCPSPGTRGPPGLLDGSLADFGDGEGAPLPLGLVTHGQPGRGPRTWLGSSLSLCHSTQCCQGLGLGVEPPTAAALHDVGDPWGRLGREAVRGPAAHDPNKAPSPSPHRAVVLPVPEGGGMGRLRRGSSGTAPLRDGTGPGCWRGGTAVTRDRW